MEWDRNILKQALWLGLGERKDKLQLSASRSGRTLAIQCFGLWEEAGEIP